MADAPALGKRHGQRAGVDRERLCPIVLAPERIHG